MKKILCWFLGHKWDDFIWHPFVSHTDVCSRCGTEGETVENREEL